MCAWALVRSGVSRVCFGAYDYSYGACGSWLNVMSHPMAKGVECYGGILERECSELISSFFRNERGKKQ
jgi:tRNA(adenine34) deaminase